MNDCKLLHAQTFPPQTLEGSAVKNREIEIVVKFVVSAMSYQKSQ